MKKTFPPASGGFPDRGTVRKAYTTALYTSNAFSYFQNKAILGIYSQFKAHTMGTKYRVDKSFHMFRVLIKPSLSGDVNSSEIPYLSYPIPLGAIHELAQIYPALAYFL